MKMRIKDFFKEHEDVVIVFHKFRPILATMNFETKYIKELKESKKIEQNVPGTLRVFSWTENKYRNVDPKTIKSLIPLASILKNEEVLA